MDQIEFNHQRGGGTAGAIGNITHERVYIKSSFGSNIGVKVKLCENATVSKEDVVDPVWMIGGLPGDWKPSTKNKGWDIGRIPLLGDGLYFLEVRGYIDTFFEVVGLEVTPVERGNLAATVARMFSNQVTTKRNELPSMKAARDEELDFARREAERQGWPVLNGSEKQVAWAIAIRSKVARLHPALPELQTRTAAKYWIERSI